MSNTSLIGKTVKFQITNEKMLGIYGNDTFDGTVYKEKGRPLIVAIMQNEDTWKFTYFELDDVNILAVKSKHGGLA